MKNIDDWKKLLSELIKKVNIEYQDSVSIFAKHNDGYLVIEKDGGLQVQFRKSLDHSDVVLSEDIVCDKRITSELTSNNYDNVKNIIKIMCYSIC